MWVFFPVLVMVLKPGFDESSEVRARGVPANHGANYLGWKTVKALVIKAPSLKWNWPVHDCHMSWEVWVEWTPRDVREAQKEPQLRRQWVEEKKAAFAVQSDTEGYKIKWRNAMYMVLYFLLIKCSRVVYSTEFSLYRLMLKRSQDTALSVFFALKLETIHRESFALKG